jgi:signal-transduction protein with cAMP-binding, CBS, and nucleotidyltransferase domain
VNRPSRPTKSYSAKATQATGIYFIKDGSVLISTTVSTGDSKVLTKIGPGEMFGEMAVVDDEPRSASAMAERKTSVYFIARPELLKFMDRIPRLASALMRELSRRQRTFNDQYVREVFEAERLQLVGRFASSIVHDLKNPLNIIGISADMACMPSATRNRARLRPRCAFANRSSASATWSMNCWNSRRALIPILSWPG